MTVSPASGSLAEAVMPTLAPATAFWAIWLVVVSASAGVLKATGSWLLRTPMVKVWVAVLWSDDVAVTVSVIDAWVSKSSVPVPERGDDAGLLPNRIADYRRPLEEDFPDPAELEQEIRVTVLHELGHYFGLDEDRLAELGYE